MPPIIRTIDPDNIEYVLKSKYTRTDFPKFMRLIRSDSQLSKLCKK